MQDLAAPQAGNGFSYSGSSPLSSVQQGMLFHHLREPHSGVDVEQVVVDLPEGVDPSVLEGAWQHVIERHPVLRTAFSWESPDEPVQSVTAHVPFVISHQNWRDLPSELQDSETAKLLLQDRLQGFDLRFAPLMRVYLIDLPPQHSRLIWSFHHILLDGRSFSTILREVFALVEDPSLELPPSPPPYSIYTLWLHQLDNSEADRFWRDKLQGFQAPTPLYSDPSLHCGERAVSARYGEAEVSIPLATSNCIRRFANQESVTVNTLVMAAWAILLMRWSGEDDVVFDVTKTARHCGVDRADEMVGLFLNTLPMRVSAVAELPLREFLLAVRSEWLSLRKYEFTPLVDIRRASEVPISQPLSESLVVFENQRFSTELQSLGGSWSDRKMRLLEQTNYAITIAAYNDPEIVFKLEFDSNRFARETIDRTLGHLVTLLEGMLANPNCQIGALPLLTAGECRQLIEWNDTAVDFPRNASLHEFIEAQVERTPDAVALICESQELTYRELNQRANQLASRLRRMGVGPDDRVAVYAERSVEMVVALLGTMKAGGAYVPLDPENPSARISVMLEDAEPVAVLTQQHLPNPLPAHNIPLVCLDGKWPPDISTEPMENLPVLTAGNDAAYVIYTSGSTGKPKGVVNVHSGIVNRLLWMQHQYHLNSTDRVLQKTPYSFDVSVWEFFWPLMTGACLVMARPGGHKDPGYLVDVIAEREITTIHFVPAMLSVFLEAGNLDRCASLRRVICSGEALPFELQAKFFQRMSAELYNLYGPTEAAIDVSSWRCRPDTHPGVVPIGKPVWNTQLRVLDKHLQQVPIGVPGELHIGGVQLARGYLKRPELTAEMFIPDPFSTAAGDRLYKTGDLARFLDTGDIEYLGRLDHQVKIRGLRIELGEIEAALGDCPGVKAPVVLAREDRPGDKRLVAYLVPVPGEEPSPVGLSERLKQRLPEYMVPTAYVFLPSFPLNVNGKLDRRALPAPDFADFGPVASYVPPTDMYEETLCEIWAKVLGRDRVSIHDNFFELGGHSLLAVRALALILERWSYHRLTIAVFIEFPTVAQFATIIRSGRLIKTESLVPFRVQGNKYPLFCIPGGGGNVVSLRKFASGFSVDQPLYCLQAKGLDGSEPLRTVEDQARFYISEIRKVQPRGPYHLAGMCFGGLVAFEMARILRSQDEAVGLLALLDTYNSAFWSTVSKRQLFNAHFSFYARRAAVHLRRLRKTPWHEKLRYLKTNATAYSKYAAELFRSSLGRSRRTVQVPPTNDTGNEHRGFLKDVLHRVAQASAVAANQYVPKYYDGDVVVFTASDRLIELYQDDALGWRSFARSVEAIELPGTHMFFLDGPGRAVATRRIEQATGKRMTGVTTSSQLKNVTGVAAVET